jgi:hypothetical protein
MARRVVICGYASSMSRQRIWELYTGQTDPNFPAPWPTAGMERLWSRARAERSYWQARRPRARPLPAGTPPPVMSIRSCRATGIAPGPALADLVDIGGVPVGLLVCSELWLPEVARVLAVRGAELLLAPAGGAFGPLARNWHAVARAHAIENQCYLALTQGLFGGEPGWPWWPAPKTTSSCWPMRACWSPTLPCQWPRWLRATDDSMAEPNQTLMTASAGQLRELAEAGPGDQLGGQGPAGLDQGGQVVVD